MAKKQEAQAVMAQNPGGLKLEDYLASHSQPATAARAGLTPAAIAKMVRARRDILVIETPKFLLIETKIVSKNSGGTHV